MESCHHIRPYRILTIFCTAKNKQERKIIGVARVAASEGTRLPGVTPVSVPGVALGQVCGFGPGVSSLTLTFFIFNLIGAAEIG